MATRVRAAEAGWDEGRGLPRGEQTGSVAAARLPIWRRPALGRRVTPSLWIGGAIVLALVVGYLLGMVGGSDGGIRSVMGLGTAQRNISAALVVAAQNFDTHVITYLMVIAVIGLVILMPAAGELGKRAKVAAGDEQQ